MGVANHYCCGKTISNAYSEYVFVVSVIKHGMRMHHIVICVLSSSTVLLALFRKGYDFRNKVTEYKIGFLLSLHHSSENFSF